MRMKSFVFLDHEYEDLNSLGLAFKDHFKSAVDAIQDPKFIVFIKQFKEKRKDLLRMLYETRYLQSAVSVFIFHMTEDHFLVLGGKTYANYIEVLKDVKNNNNIVLFLEDKGFRNTIFTLDLDEKVKMDLMAAEDHFNDDFVHTFLETYESYDSIENIRTIFSEMFVSQSETFKTARNLFSVEKNCLYLAHHFSLKDVMEMKQSGSPVFKGLYLLSSDDESLDVLSVLKNAFYLFGLENLKSYTFKKDAKKLKKEYQKSKKEWAKKCKKDSSVRLQLQMHEYYFNLYLRLVDQYHKGNVIVKKNAEDYRLDIPYENTYICPAYMNINHVTMDENPKEYEPLSQVSYDIEKLSKAIRHHYYFGGWLMVLTLIFTLILSAGVIINAFWPNVLVNVSNLKAAISSLIDIKGGLISFIIGAGLSFFMACFILIKTSSAKRKYYQLCKLAYYRNNESILTSKEREHYEKLKLKEIKNVKVIDRFYRFYGAFAMGCFCILMVVFGLTLMMAFGKTISEEVALNASNIISGKENSYFIYLPSIVAIVLGLLRHKKTSWSILFTFVLGLGCAIGLCFISF